MFSSKHFFTLKAVFAAFTCILGFSLSSCGTSKEVLGNSEIVASVEDSYSATEIEERLRKNARAIAQDKSFYELNTILRNKVLKRIAAIKTNTVKMELLKQAYTARDGEKIAQILELSDTELTEMAVQVSTLHQAMINDNPQIFTKKVLHDMQVHLAKYPNYPCLNCTQDIALKNFLENRINNIAILPEPGDVPVPAPPSPGLVCDFAGYIGLMLWCQTKVTACLIGAAFTPPPVNGFIAAVCIIDWIFCGADALEKTQCK